MATNRITGRFGTYYNMNTDGSVKQPDGPEMILFLKDKGDVYGTDECITIPGMHLSAFIVELIHMARDLGVTPDNSKGAEK